MTKPFEPSNLLTLQPSNRPTFQPSNLPTFQISNLPTFQLSYLLALQPSNIPTFSQKCLETGETTKSLKYGKCLETGETTKSFENNYFFKGFGCFSHFSSSSSSTSSSVPSLSRVTSVKSLAGILTHQGDISKVSICTLSDSVSQSVTPIISGASCDAKNYTLFSVVAKSDLSQFTQFCPKHSFCVEKNLSQNLPVGKITNMRY